MFLASFLSQFRENRRLDPDCCLHYVFMRHFLGNACWIEWFSKTGDHSTGVHTHAKKSLEW